MNIVALDVHQQLALIASEINELHAAVARHREEGLRAAILAGQRLIEVKEKVPKGEWLTWVGRNCTFSERTARDYMDTARDAASVTPVTGPSFRKARRQLAEKRRSSSNSEKGSNVVQLNARKPDATAYPRKGRAAVRKRKRGAPTPRQAAFIEAPKFFEDFLIALERCATVYGLPEIPQVLRTLMRERIGKPAVEEMIAYLKQVADAMESNNG